MTSAREKIIDIDLAARKVRAARRRGECVVFTNGCFDLLHTGHVRGLEAARALGDRLIVAINHDASVRRLKGPERPIQPARVRKEVVAAMACVDWVVGFSSDTPLRLIRALRPDILAKGGDYDLHEIVGREDVEAYGGRVARLPLVAGYSTTNTILRSRQGPGLGLRKSPRKKR